MNIAVNLFCCLVVCFTGTFCISAQNNTVDLKDKRITIHMDNQPLGVVFRYLIGECDVPVGFEESSLDGDHDDYDFDTSVPAVGTKRMASSDGNVKITVRASRSFQAKSHLITVNLDGEPVEKVFDVIVKQMRNYKWEIDNGVVNIIPNEGRDERFEKLLGLNINRFAVGKGETVRTITTNIRELPEFRLFLAENQLYFTGFRGGSEMLVKAQYDRPLGTGMDLSNVTFRELLNKATAVKRGGWRLVRKKRSRAGEEHIDVDI